MYRTLIVATCALLAAAAQAEAPAPSNQASATAPAKAKKVCRVGGATTGSIMKQKTCHTQAEWEAIDKANRLEMDTRDLMRGSGGTGVR